MALTSERFAVVGLGRLGTCLVRAFLQAGIDVTGITSQHFDRALQYARDQNLPNVVTTLGQVAQHADIVFVTVPDTELANVAEKLEVQAGQSVVHCSGALGLAPLAAAAARG